MDFNLSLFKICLSFFLPSTSPITLRAAVDGILRVRESHRDFRGRLTETAWGMTADS